MIFPRRFLNLNIEDFKYEIDHNMWHTKRTHMYVAAIYTLRGTFETASENKAALESIMYEWCLNTLGPNGVDWIDMREEMSYSMAAIKFRFKKPGHAALFRLAFG